MSSQMLRMWGDAPSTENGGADDEDVPVADAAPAPAEDDGDEPLDIIVGMIDEEAGGASYKLPSLPTAGAASLPTAGAAAAPPITLGAARQLRIGPWGRPAAVAPSTAPSTLHDPFFGVGCGRTGRHACGAHACGAEPSLKRQALDAIENDQSQGVAAPRAGAAPRAARRARTARHGAFAQSRAAPSAGAARHGAFAAPRAAPRDAATARRAPRAVAMVQLSAATKGATPPVTGASGGRKCAWCPRPATNRGPRGSKLCGTCCMRWRRGETGPRPDEGGWSCGWCGVEETSKRFKGPKGPGTLCEPCGRRHAHGATGPPAKNWQCDWCPETTGRRLRGPKGSEILCTRCGGRFLKGKTGPRDDDLAVGDCITMGGASGTVVALPDNWSAPWWKVRLDGEEKVRSVRRAMFEPASDGEEAPAPPSDAEEAPPQPDAPATKPSFAFTNVSTGKQVQKDEPDEDLPPSRPSSEKTRKRSVIGDLRAIMGGDALGRVRALLGSVLGASSKLKDSTLKTLRNRRKTSRKGLSSKTLRSRVAELTAKAQKQATHPLVDQQGDGDDGEFDDSITDLVRSQLAAKSEKAVADDFHKALDALRKPDRTAEGTTTAKGVGFVVDGEAVRADGSSNEEGVDADAWRICLLACADHFGRLARDFPQQSIHDAVVSAIAQTEPCESAIAKLLTAETYAIIKRLVARVEARCPKNKCGYKLAWAAFAGAARHAAHHGEELVLYRLLSALRGRSAKITIVSFGHPACDDCFCLLSLLGDVEESTAVPAALCPSGLNHRNVGVACGVSTMDWQERKVTICALNLGRHR